MRHLGVVWGKQGVTEHGIIRCLDHHVEFVSG